MSQTILYYPTINIRNYRWLKSAILYWDNVASIVPYENYDNFSRSLQYLQHSGVYTPLYPQRLFQSEHAYDFTNTIINEVRLLMPETNSPRRRRSRSDVNTVSIHREKIQSSHLHNTIHYNKLPYDLIDFLIESGMLIDYQHNDWMEIDQRLANIYMKSLAKYLVKCYPMDIVIGTDRVTKQNSLYCETTPSPDTSCVTLSLERCFPRPSPKMSFDDLLNFKYRYRIELGELRKKIREYELQLYSSKSIEEVKHHTEAFRESWQQCLLQEKRLFTQHKQGFVLDSLETLIELPANLEAIETMSNGTIPNGSIANMSVFAGIASVIIALKHRNYKNGINNQRSSAGFSYLMKAASKGIIDISDALDT